MIPAQWEGPLVRLLCVALGGGLGASARYVLGGLIQGRAGDALQGTRLAVFPWGTLAINLIGCFAIGLLWVLAEERQMSPNLRMFIFVGILGGFTTFSSYALECFNLAGDRELALTLGNILASNVVGLGLVYVGAVAGRALLAAMR